jgi:hypothetical protein
MSVKDQLGQSKVNVARLSEISFSALPVGKPSVGAGFAMIPGFVRSAFGMKEIVRISHRLTFTVRKEAWA